MSSFETSYLGATTQLIAELAKNIGQNKDTAEYYISKLEISVRLESKNRAQAISIFEKNISKPKALEKKIERIKAVVHRKPDSAIACIDALFRAFSKERSILPQIETDIQLTANSIGISQKNYNRIRNSYLREKRRLTPICDISFYRTLGCKGTESFDEIKKKYHQLALQHHPDTRKQLTISEEEADKKFQAILISYLKIKNAFAALDRKNIF